MRRTRGRFSRSGKLVPVPICEDLVDAVVAPQNREAAV